MEKKRLADYMPYDDGSPRGMFGYQGSSIDMALARDDEAAIKNAHDFGWIIPETVTLMNTPILRLARERGHTKCAELLCSLGYAE